MKKRTIELRLEIEVEDDVTHVAFDKCGDLYGYTCSPIPEEIFFGNWSHSQNVVIANWKDTVIELGDE